MKITYTHQFVSQCPNNGLPIVYDLAIETDGAVIQVEKIATACAFWREAYHEDIAKRLAELFPGTRQTLTAMHHGVGIKTEVAAA